MSDIKINKDWFSQKIKGDFAEIVCENHLRSIGYTVEKSGIESIAPVYSQKSLASELKSNLIKNHLNKTPDFIVSKGDSAFFVEAKYDTTISKSEGNSQTHQDAFYKYGAKLLKKYRNVLFKHDKIDIINDKMSREEVEKTIADELKKENGDIREVLLKGHVKVIFYVMVPHNDFYKSHISIFIPDTYNPAKKNLGWRSFQNDKVDKDSGIIGLQQGYIEIVEPFLNDVFKTKKKVGK